MTAHIWRVMPPDLKSRPCGGSPGYQYALGEWTPRVKNPRLCQSGFHTLSPAGLLDYAKEGDVLVRNLRRGIGESDYQKATNASIMPAEVVGIVTARALRLTAADSAESVLHLYTAEYDDETVEATIYTLRAYALGGADEEELLAASAASWAASREASRAASREASRAASAASRAASRAASAASWAASWAASRAASAASWAASAASWAASGKSLIRHIKEES
jgi:hypothetical protein